MAAPGLEQAGGVGLLGLPAVESLGGFETADLYPIPQLLGNNGQVGNISVRSAGRPFSGCIATVAAHPEKGQKQMQPGLSRVDIERHGPPGLGQVAPGRWHGGIYHARLASFPIHMGVFLTQRGRCSETDLRKFLDFFG